jgi:hypothetical protein
VNEGAGFNDGSPSKIDIASASGVPTGSASRTVSLWLKTTDSNNKEFFQSGDDLGTAGDQFALLNISGKDYFSGGSGRDKAGNRTINNGAWHMFTVTYDGTVVSLYVDGTLDVSSTLSLSTNSNHVDFGSTTAGGNYLTGDLDEIGVWSKVLSTQEITDLWNGESGQTMVAQ